METYNGHVRTPADAILLFEACRIGLLPRVQRRLSEKERQQIKSGSVFVWDEREAGMRRWTDGKSWSASRVSGSFLTYREMEGKRGGNFPAAPAPKRPSGKSPDGSATGDSEGEGPDGYRYKPDGLMKQSFSITTSGGQHLHLISYYSRSHPAGLQQPTTDSQLRHIRPPKNMYPESSVNENANVPAVTRGPMPGSPYASAPPPMGSPSPYPRPSHSPHAPIIVGFPSPHAPPTPPYQTAYYIPPHMAYPQGFYYAAAPPGYPPQQFPHMAHPHHPHFSGHPAYSHPQYVAHPAARPMHSAELPVHEQAHNNSQPPPSHANSVPASTVHEQGPVLPALNGIGKPPTPQPSDAKTSERSNASAVAPNTATSPTRTIPNIQTLLNDHATNTSTEANAKATQPGSRSGSRSPGAPQRPPREMIATANSSAADTSAIHKLNSAFL